MVKEEEEDWQNEWADDHKDFLRGIRGWRMSVPKLCDVCQVSGSVMFCRAHSAHLCMVCDVKIHVGSSSNNNNRRSSSSPSSSLCHERVWLCEVCEQAPASVTCKADAAALCVSCDSDIHSANPLARKHERIPVTPFYESPNMGNNNNGNKFSSLSLECNDVLNEDHDGGEDRRLKRDDEEECNGLLSHRSEPGNHEAEMSCAEGAAVAAASWLIPEAGKNNLRIINGVAEAGGGEDKTVKDKLKFKAYLQSIDFLEDVDDPYVGFEYLGSNGGNTAVNANAREALATTHLGATDSMVPVHTPEVIEHSSTKVSDESGSLDADLSKSNYGYRSASLNNSVSSCIDVGIVPETSMNEIYNEGARGSFEIPPRVVHNPGTQFEAMGREARVLRYREKRKNRKFEKTIRYASRKAYAETRPRIKGRFAKRTDVEEVEGEVERLYSSSPSVLSDQGYGVVPSF